MTPNNDAEFQQRMQQVEGLVEQLEDLTDPVARELSRRLTQSLLDLHAVGLRKMLETLPTTNARPPEIPPQWLDDPLIANLLLLHDLHPVDVDIRLEQAINDIRTQLDEQGVTLHVLERTGDSVRVRATGGCGGCPSSTQKLRRIVDESFCRIVPELSVALEGLDGVESATVSEPSLPILHQ